MSDITPAPTSAASHPHPTEVTIEIRSTSGNLYDQKFNTSERAQAILTRAIDRIPLDPRPERPYTLVLQRTGGTLALNETIGDLGIVTGDVVIVQAHQPIDGSERASRRRI